MQSDIPTMRRRAGGIIMRWRFTKKKVPRFKRSATGGLAAKLMSIPITIIMSMAETLQRSTVHHQRPRMLVSRREKVTLDIKIQRKINRF
jgi:hypothetical protein